MRVFRKCNDKGRAEVRPFTFAMNLYVEPLKNYGRWRCWASCPQAAEMSDPRSVRIVALTRIFLSSFSMRTISSRLGGLMSALLDALTGMRFMCAWRS